MVNMFTKVNLPHLIKATLGRSLIMSTLFVMAGLLQAAEPPNGKALYENFGKGGCIQCHGQIGNEPIMPFYPRIAGQTELYLYNQMLDYKYGRRTNGLYVPMEVAMQPYSDIEIKAIAHYLATNEPF